jgi:hypothetical protein
MTVGRFASVPVLGATVFVALGLFVPSAVARPTSAPTASIVSVRAVVPTQNNGFALTRGKLNVVVASTALAFKIDVQNTGSARKTGAAVKLMIRASRASTGTIERTVTLDSIAPSQTKTVTFSHLGAVEFGVETSLTVRVGNGPAKLYSVLFSLPG